MSIALLWINSFYLGLLLLCSIMFFIGSDGPNIALGISGLLALCARICWIVTIPIVYHRIKESEYSA